MRQSRPETPLEVEVQILRYLEQHPEAKDTVKGIASWWLTGRGGRVSVGEVKAALERLVAQGKVMAEQHADGQVYYHRAKPARSQDAAGTI